MYSDTYLKLMEIKATATISNGEIIKDLIQNDV